MERVKHNYLHLYKTVDELNTDYYGENYNEPWTIQDNT